MMIWIACTDFGQFSGVLVLAFKLRSTHRTFLCTDATVPFYQGKLAVEKSCSAPSDDASASMKLLK